MQNTKNYFAKGNEKDAEFRGTKTKYATISRKIVKNFALFRKISIKSEISIFLHFFSRNYEPEIFATFSAKKRRKCKIFTKRFPNFVVNPRRN